MRPKEPQMSRSNSYLRTASPPSIHIFPQASHESLVTELTALLKKQHLRYQIYNRPEALQTLLATINRNDGKMVILIEGNQYHHNNVGPPNSLFLNNSKMPRSDQRVKICYFNDEHYSPSSKDALRQTVDLCKKWLNKDLSKHKVQLRSVHSLSTSREKRMTPYLSGKILKTPEPTEYEGLFYQADNYTSSESNTYIHYEQLSTALENFPRTYSFRSFHQLKNKIFPQTKKSLLLTGTNNKSLQLLEDLKKARLHNADIILMGQLLPSHLLLDRRVVLATSQPSEVLDFLRTHGFEPIEAKHDTMRLTRKYSMSSTDFKNLMSKIMREDSDYSSSNNIFRSSLRNGFKNSTIFKDKNVRHWKVDKDENYQDRFVTVEVHNSEMNISDGSDKRRVKKLKSISKIKEESSMQPKSSEYISQKTIQPIQNGEGGPVQSRPSIPSSNTSPSGKQIAHPGTQQAAQPESSGGLSQSIQPMFSYEQRRQNYPSKVIKEVSEEYQASRKSSVMNLQGQASVRTLRGTLGNSQQSAEMRHTTMKEHNNYGFKFNPNHSLRQSNSQQSVSIGSTQKLTQEHAQRMNTKNRDQIDNASTKQIGQEEAVLPQKTYASQGEGQHSATPATTTTNTANTTTTYRSPARVVKKAQISTPEEVYQQTQKAIHSNSQTSQGTIQAPHQVLFHTTNNANAPPATSPNNRQVLASSRLQYSSPVHQAIEARKPGSPKQVIPSALQPSYHKQFEGFERVEKDGVVIYRRKNNEKQGGFHARVLSPSQRPQENNVRMEYPVNYPKPMVHEPIGQRSVRALYEPVQMRRQVLDSPQYREVSAGRVGSPISPPSSVHTPQMQVVSQSKLPPNTARKSNPFNESMVSRMSQLHSDGSILRRNNVRFGIKKKEDKLMDHSMFPQESKLKSVLYKAETGRRNSINRAIFGEEYLEDEHKKLLHIDSGINSFHFLVHEDLSYLMPILEGHLVTRYDSLQSFANIESMFECLRAEQVQDNYDAGFIFTLQSQLNFINPRVLPEDYYMVVIDRSKGASLEISEDSRKVKIDQLAHLPLAQKIIVESKMYQYVAYRHDKGEMGVLADKFLRSEFILEKIETDFTSEIMDFYYCELPRLTRLYILCRQSQLASLEQLIQVYREVNPSFRPESCKLICVIENILSNESQIMQYPSVTFINNPQEIRHYTDILRYAHYNQEPKHGNHWLPLDHFFYPQHLSAFEHQIHQAYPGRYYTIPFQRLNEVYLKVQQLNKQNKNRPKCLLLLPEQPPSENIRTQLFHKVYLLGKAAVQPVVTRVHNLEELVAMLRF